VSSHHLQGTVSQLLSSSAPIRRRVGITACAMHRVDPGAVLDTVLEISDAALLARTLRTLGELGRRHALATVRSILANQDECCRFWAAWSALLLGDRGVALDVLGRISQSPGPSRDRAMWLALRTMELRRTRELLKVLA